MPIDTWIPAGIGVAAAALGWWKASGISEVKFQERLTQLKDEMEKSHHIAEQVDGDFKTELRSAVSELRAVAMTIAKLTAGQDIINTITAKTLESLTRKTEEQDRRIGEISATQTLIVELLKKERA